MSFEPLSLFEIELSNSDEFLLEAVPAPSHRHGLCLVRFHGEPLGLVPVHLGAGLPTPGEVRELATAAFAEHISRHLHHERRIVRASAPPSGPARNGRTRRERSVTVVVPTRERPERLEGCLRSLVALDYPNFEIVVVDNARVTPRSEALVRELASVFPGLRYEHEPRRGQAWARNRGLTVTSSDLVAFVDDDVLVDSRWLQAVTAAFDAALDVGCVTGLILPAELETEAQALLEAYGGFGKGFQRRIYGLGRADRPPDPLFPYSAGSFGSGASMAFDTVLLRELGGFDVALASGSSPCGGEELSAFLRVLLTGHSLVYEPSAIVRHFHPRDYEIVRRTIRGYGVGLGAYLTACVVDDPRALGVFVRRAGTALRHFFAQGSPKNKARDHTYPRSLVVLEAIGLLAGPFAYLRGRFAARALRRTDAPVALQPGLWR